MSLDPWSCWFCSGRRLVVGWEKAVGPMADGRVRKKTKLTCRRIQCRFSEGKHWQKKHQMRERMKVAMAQWTTAGQKGCPIQIGKHIDRKRENTSTETTDTLPRSTQVQSKKSLSILVVVVFSGSWLIVGWKKRLTTERKQNWHVKQKTDDRLRYYSIVLQPFLWNGKLRQQ